MISNRDTSSLAVVHSLPTWLPLTATWLHNQVRGLPSEIKSHIVCETTENLDQFNLLNIHCLKDQPRSSLVPEGLLRRLRLQKLLSQPYLDFLERVASINHARILHSHWGDTGWRDVHAAKKSGLCHVVSFYGKDVNYYPQFPIWRRRYQHLFQQVDLILCEGPHMAQCIMQLGCPAAKIRVQHLGVDLDRIEFRPRIWKDGPLRVLIACSFREKKGIPYALHALGLLQKQLPALEITIIGDASRDPRSHPEKARILEGLRQHQLEDQTRLMGYQTHTVLFEEAYKHHIFISPSVTASDGDTEGGAPVTLIEMAATGMPIVSTTHCDIPSIILHGKTGLLAAERDVDGLLQHLRRYVEHPESWHEILISGRRHIESEYNVTKQAVKLRDIYLSLFASKGNG
ncbi:MAG: colanic acid biosynthesis glycosyltransferase WcaL [Acidobacteria bacterium]|nr:MAG: colanic acid biosynthesis glycosyltransferase WcaL [Acidobacteriota bacterium]